MPGLQLPSGCLGAEVVLCTWGWTGFKEVLAGDFPLPCLAAGNKTATTKNACTARVSHLSSWHAEFGSHLLRAHFCPCGSLLATVSSLYQTANELHLTQSSLRAPVMNSSELKCYSTPLNMRSYIVGGDETSRLARGEVFTFTLCCDIYLQLTWYYACLALPSQESHSRAIPWQPSL